ncbi:MAG: hypothetical protein Q8O25_16840 [Sulfurisoma sp.]|nr:hypothetical protein [Sulfurisoma sp.]
MRTTLALEDTLAGELKKMALETGKPFKQVVNETLLLGLRQTAHRPQAYRLKPASLGSLRAGFDLDKALQLADMLEDDALAGKLEQRK